MDIKMIHQFHCKECHSQAIIRKSDVKGYGSEWACTNEDCENSEGTPFRGDVIQVDWLLEEIEED